MSEPIRDKSEHEDKPDSDTTVSQSEGDTLPGGQIGPYKLLRVLGEGGFAIVYLADQQRPVKRHVALKVLKPGMDSKQVLARFDAERQALALLDHPNIAQIYDGGMTETGRPYFVMEHVKGVSITEHCDHHKLSIEDRLHLFLPICDAVHHAHQKGIVHRDIKPSNVIVSLDSGQAVPKVIDFGVAKAMAQPLTQMTLFTERGQLLGTPEYMSPEQAAMTNQEVDARSDVYSLGVMLYELLTGALPFDRRTLDNVELDEFRRIIREVDPPKPSTKLSSLGDEATRIASCRCADVRTLARCLQRELEWIPLKAMRKEVAHRYGSPCELAEDIRRYLAGMPLFFAGPPTVLYKIRKYVRKHNSAWTAALLLITLANTTFTVVYAGHVRRNAQQQNAQMAMDPQVTALMEFLDRWWTGRTEEARVSLAKFQAGSTAEIGVRLLLDPDSQDSAHLDRLRNNCPCLYWLILGDGHLRSKEREEALNAYRQCCQSRDDDSELSRWCRIRARERAVMLGADSSLLDSPSDVMIEDRLQ
jgi:serine/threonine protein kinase